MSDGRLRFGVTLAQIDQLERLVRTIIANGDVIAVGGVTRLEPATLTAIGEAVFSCGCAVRGILDEIEEQRLVHEAMRAGGADAVPDDA